MHAAAAAAAAVVAAAVEVVRSSKNVATVMSVHEERKLQKTEMVLSRVHPVEPLHLPMNSVASS